MLLSWGFFVAKLMWPFGTVSFSLIHVDGLVPINFKEVSGLKVFSLIILAGRLWAGSRDGTASNLELQFSSKQQ